MGTRNLNVLVKAYAEQESVSLMILVSLTCSLLERRRRVLSGQKCNPDKLPTYGKILKDIFYFCKATAYKSCCKCDSVWGGSIPRWQPNGSIVLVLLVGFQTRRMKSESCGFFLHSFRELLRLGNVQQGNPYMLDLKGQESERDHCTNL